MAYQPVARIRGRRYVTLTEASAMLGGLLSPGTIRGMIRAGEVPGSLKARGRYFLLRATVSELVTDMSAGVPRAQVSELIVDMGAGVVEAAPPRVPRPQRNTFDRAG